MSGAAGHINHLYEDESLTVKELKDILATACAGELSEVSEKFDGQNIMFTCVMGDVLVARSITDIKNGGLTQTELVEKFALKPHVQEAFVQGFVTLSQALKSLGWETCEDIFCTSDGKRVWMSCEIIYTKNPNVINYDKDAIIFHTMPIYIADGVEVRTLGDDGRATRFAKRVSTMQAALQQRNWLLASKQIVRLQRLADGSVLDTALEQINDACAAVGASDADTLHHFLYLSARNHCITVGLSPVSADATARRLARIPGHLTLTQLQNSFKGGTRLIHSLVKSEDVITKQCMAPIERAVNAVAVAVLSGMCSALVSNRDVEIQRVRQELSRTVKELSEIDSPLVRAKLTAQLERMQTLDEYSQALEGVVFKHRSKFYKFTGTFAPVNQILGMLRYER